MTGLLWFAIGVSAPTAHTGSGIDPCQLGVRRICYPARWHGGRVSQPDKKKPREDPENTSKHAVRDIWNIVLPQPAKRNELAIRSVPHRLPRALSCQSRRPRCRKVSRHWRCRDRHRSRSQRL